MAYNCTRLIVPTQSLNISIHGSAAYGCHESRLGEPQMVRSGAVVGPVNPRGREPARLRGRYVARKHVGRTPRGKEVPARGTALQCGKNESRYSHHSVYVRAQVALYFPSSCTFPPIQYVPGFQTFDFPCFLLQARASRWSAQPVRGRQGWP